MTPTTNPHHLIRLLRQGYGRGRNVQFLLDVLRGTRRTSRIEVLLQPRTTEILLAQRRDGLEQHSRTSGQPIVSHNLDENQKCHNIPKGETN